MKKFILTALIAATALPSAAMAQSAGELRHDRREVREQRQDLRDAQRHGDHRDVRDARKDLREARQEYREDWRDYRAKNRTVYNRGNWRAPFRYQRFAVGSTIRPGYYGSRYYVANPGRYHLPAAGQNMRWIRHYDDVLLVNVRTGRVVQVYHNFYW